MALKKSDRLAIDCFKLAIAIPLFVFSMMIAIPALMFVYALIVGV